MRETSRYLNMFEYYYNLGSDRTFAKVSDHFDVSRQTVARISRELKWAERVRQRDFEVYKELREENNDEIKSTLNSYRKVIKASVADYIARLKDGKIKVDNVRDFVKLVELELKICGFQEQLDSEKAESLEVDKTITFVFKGSNQDDSESE
jgi:Zn-dependent peptidase ImmA (M78 family)